MNKSKRKTDVFFCIICVPRGALNLAPFKKKKITNGDVKFVI